MPTTTRWPYTAPWNVMGWSASEQGNHLFHRVQSQQVQLSCRGKGFGRRSLRLTLMSTAAEAAQVEIPKGTLFIPDSNFEQTLICSEDAELTLEGGGSATVELDAYCGLSSAACPGGAMQVTALQAPPRYIGSQGKTWAWTDGYASPDLQLPAGMRPASQETDLLAREYPDEDFSDHCPPQSAETAASEPASEDLGMPRSSDDSTSGDANSEQGGSGGWSFWSWGGSSADSGDGGGDGGGGGGGGGD